MRFPAAVPALSVLFALVLLVPPSPCHAVHDMWVENGVISADQALTFGWTFGAPPGSGAPGDKTPFVSTSRGGDPPVYTEATFEWYLDLDESGSLTPDDVLVLTQVWGDGQVGGGDDRDGAMNGTFTTTIRDLRLPPGRHVLSAYDAGGADEVALTVLPVTEGKLVEGLVDVDSRNGDLDFDPAHRVVVASVYKGDSSEPVSVAALVGADGRFELRIPEAMKDWPAILQVPGFFACNQDPDLTLPVPVNLCGVAPLSGAVLLYQPADGFIEGLVYEDLGLGEGPEARGEPVRREVIVTVSQTVSAAAGDLPLYRASARTEAGWFRIPVRQGDYSLAVENALPSYLECDPFIDPGMWVSVGSGEVVRKDFGLYPVETMVDGVVDLESGGDPSANAWMPVQAVPAEPPSGPGTGRARTFTEADGSFQIPVSFALYPSWGVCPGDGLCPFCPAGLPEGYSGECAYVHADYGGGLVVSLRRNENPIHPPDVRAEWGAVSEPGEQGLYSVNVSWEPSPDSAVDEYMVFRSRACPLPAVVYAWETVGIVPGSQTHFRDDVCRPPEVYGDGQEAGYPGYYYGVAAVAYSEGLAGMWSSSPNEFDYVYLLPCPEEEPESPAVAGRGATRTVVFPDAELVRGFAVLPDDGGNSLRTALVAPRPWPAAAWRDAADYLDVRAAIDVGDARQGRAVAPGAAGSAAAGGVVVSVARVGSGSEEGARVRYRLLARAEVAADVFDVRGRRVWGVPANIMDAGSHDVEWTGRDANGSPVAAGIYFMTLRAGGERHTVKLPVQR